MTQEYTGKSPYTPNYQAGAIRLLVAITCFVEDLPERFYALLDTAGEWCVLPPSLAVRVGFDLDVAQTPVVLSTRFGLFHGRLERARIRFDATEGEALEQESTCFVSTDWPGPLVIGWRGCLERMRFGFDPMEEAFYFGGE